MKKIISLIMIVILTIFMVGCSNKKQTFYKNQINIVSDSKGEYVIVLSDDTKEIDTYSMYKLISYQEYEKLYDFPVSSNQAIIFHRILWNDDKFYLFEDGVKLYDAETGNEISKSSINTTPADDEKCYNRINKGTFYGMDNKYVYYGYFCDQNQKDYEAKITLDLKNVTLIEKKDIPSNLIK